MNFLLLKHYYSYFVDTRRKYQGVGWKCIQRQAGRVSFPTSVWLHFNGYLLLHSFLLFFFSLLQLLLLLFLLLLLLLFSLLLLPWQWHGIVHWMRMQRLTSFAFIPHKVKANSAYDLCLAASSQCVKPQQSMLARCVCVCECVCHTLQLLQRNLTHTIGASLHFARARLT